MFFILLQNFIVSSLSTTVNCWRQKLFCFLSSLSTCAELSGSCSSSRGRVGLPRNPPNYTSMGSGAKSKWSYTVLRSGFVLCVFFRWRLLNLLWVKPWGIQCNFCLSWPALTHAQLAEAGRASELSRDWCLQEEFVGAQAGVCLLLTATPQCVPSTSLSVHSRTLAPQSAGSCGILGVLLQSWQKWLA